MLFQKLANPFFYEREICQRESACQKTCALTPLPPSSFAGRQVSLALLSPSLIHQHHPHHHHQHLLHHSQRQFAIIVIFWQSIFMLCLSIIVITIIMNSSLAERGSSPPTWLLTSGWSPTSSCCRQPRCCFFFFQSVIRSNSDSKDSCNSIIFRPGSLYMASATLQHFHLLVNYQVILEVIGRGLWIFLFSFINN